MATSVYSSIQGLFDDDYEYQWDSGVDPHYYDEGPDPNVDMDIDERWDLNLWFL